MDVNVWKALVFFILYSFFFLRFTLIFYILILISSNNYSLCLIVTENLLSSVVNISFLLQVDFVSSRKQDRAKSLAKDNLKHWNERQDFSYLPKNVEREP